MTAREAVPRKVDAELARWMGYVPDPDPTNRRGLFNRTWKRGENWREPGYASHWPGPPRYSMVRDDCAQVEARVVINGWGDRYAEVLRDLACWSFRTAEERDLQLATAMPELRARALLTVIREAMDRGVT